MDEDFREQCRRQIKRSLDSRIKYGFCRVYKPIDDDMPVRVFKKMSDYRRWADENLPRYLGFQIAEKATDAK